MEETIELEIPLLLPDVQDEQDDCLKRLEAALQNQKGILRAHIEREKTPADMCLHYDPNLLTLSEVKRIAEHVGAKIINRYHHDSIRVEGMDCSDCVMVIEHSLQRLEGMVTVSASYPAEKVWVEYDSRKISRVAIEKRIRSLGYKIPQNEFLARLQKNRELLFSLFSGALLLAGWLGGLFQAFPTWLNNGFYFGAYFFGGWDVAKHAFHALRERHFDTDGLMVVAALGAAVLGDFAEGALLLFLFSLGHSLEERSLDKARAAVNALADMAPKTALVKRYDQEKELPVEELQLEDIVIVRPGVRIPVDGIIRTGASSVDQSPVTGESMPVDKVSGDKVYAGTVNGEGALEVGVTRLAKDSTLVRVMKMVEEAQAQKSQTQQTVEKFERVFVPSVLVLTILIILVLPIFGLSLQESFLRAMTLLVAASPCALALGTPASILAGVAQAARNGVLIKGGVHLENLGRINAIAFDKTGTITHGQPEVTDVYAFGMEKVDILALAAGAELRSAHPLARSIVRAAQEKEIPIVSVETVESLTGRGLRFVSQGQTFWIGNRKLMDESKVKLPTDVVEKASALEYAGKSLMWIAEGRELRGLIALADTIRNEAVLTMNALQQAGVSHTVMLTGDNTRAASAISLQAGLSEYRAELLPEDKLTAIHNLVQEYGQVAMVGDGVNDAPALANATVGIAMGGAGTDVALETADVVLMGDDLSNLPFAVGLGRATRAVIVQNLVIALGVIGLLIFSSVTGIISIGVAVVFHEGSTLVVVANALRLLNYKN